MATVASTEVAELVRSEQGAFGLRSDFNLVVIGAGTLYIAYEEPEGATEADQAQWLRDNGIPIVAGQNVDDSLIKDTVLYGTSGSGTVEYRTTRKGAV